MTKALACNRDRTPWLASKKIAEIAEPGLRQLIAEEVTKLKKRTRFGLVFEEHQPEVVPIFGARIRRNARVAKKTGSLTEIWRVLSVKDGQALCELEKVVRLPQARARHSPRINGSPFAAWASPSTHR